MKCYEESKDYYDYIEMSLKRLKQNRALAVAYLDTRKFCNALSNFLIYSNDEQFKKFENLWKEFLKINIKESIVKARAEINSILSKLSDDFAT
jgi:hypothetical protein